MPLPNLLATSTTIGPPRRRAVSPVAGQVTILPLEMEHQEQFNWCWAALAVSVRKFLSNEVVAQCAQANRQLDRADCCDDPRPCDKPSFLDLQFFTKVRQDVFSFADVKQAIDNGRPVALQIAWTDGRSHFVCVSGYNIAGGAQMVTVKDPFYGTSTLPYTVLVSAYQGSGVCAQSFRI